MTTTGETEHSAEIDSIVADDPRTSSPPAANGAANGKTSNVGLRDAEGTPSSAVIPSPPAQPHRQGLHNAGLSLTLLSLFLLGFAGFLYGMSGIEQARTQRTLYATLRNELANEVAPLGATTPGAPIAILDIPAIGVRNLVVVEGTSPENLMIGPGLVRDTPLPGQGGVSEIYGRRATFGAPFAGLSKLRPGAQIKVTTGQGVSIYRVAAFGSSSRSVRIRSRTG